MKFTLSWLKEYLDTDATLDKISKKLTDIGLEVEEIIDRGKSMEGFVVAKVETCEKHPDADRLNVVTVNTGTEKFNIVCGAPNCKAGMKGVFAPSGSYIPGLDVVLKKAKIRGVESCGMLCSEKELQLSDEHKGIIELADDIEIGSSAATALGLDDPVIDIALTPNRGDCAGVYGIARDLAAAGLGELKELTAEDITSSFATKINVDIDDEAEKDCPLFIGREIKNINNIESPDWLKQRLDAIGLRPISALVDITNYFTIGLNRPLHVYDADKIQGNISVRLSKQGEEFDALDDKHYELKDGMTAICDDSGVLGLGGIVGGVSSSVTEDTVNVYLESAYFNPVSIAMTGRSLQIDSDARYRFERGVDPEFTLKGLELATSMILDICGGEDSKISEKIIAGAVPEFNNKITYNPSLVKNYSGLEVSEEKQKEILNALGFSIVSNTSDWEITAPSWRLDIEGKADIVEEILRIYGYNEIKDTALEANDNLQPVLDIHQERLMTARRLLAGRGLAESVTYAFISSKTADMFGVKNKESLTLNNPISSEWDVMRPSLLPNLIEAASKNIDRGFPDIGLFEIANIYNAPNADGHVMTIGGVRTGMKMTRHWSGEERPIDAFDIKADALAVLNICGAPESLQVATENLPEWYHPGRSASFSMGKNVLAFFGEIHPDILNEMGVDTAIMGFEVFPMNIPVPKKKVGTARKPLNASKLQPVKRDFAFLLADSVSADKIVRAVKSVDKKLISSVDIFDVYKGKGVEDGKKSVALYVTLQPYDATLTDEDFEDITSKIIANVEKKTGGILRS